MIWLDKEGYEFHSLSGMAVVPYSSQAKGFFAKIDTYGIEGIPDGLRKLYINERNLSVYKKIKDFVSCTDRKVNDVALAYMLCQPFTTIPIVGCKSISQVRESIKATEINLSKEMILELVNHPNSEYN
mgnify:FL=1